MKYLYYCLNKQNAWGCGNSIDEAKRNAQIGPRRKRDFIVFRAERATQWEANPLNGSPSWSYDDLGTIRVRIIEVGTNVTETVHPNDPDQWSDGSYASELNQTD